jgi:hypothetical protein
MRRQRVEHCLTIGTPRGPLVDMVGKWHWQFYGVSASYSIHATRSELRVFMRVDQEIPLRHTTPNYGGIRWWFLCPKCNQRVSLLHKPPAAYCFFCRHCHDLRYESAQLSGTEGSKYLQAIAKSEHITTHEALLSLRLKMNPPYIHEIKRPVLNKVRDRRTGFALLLTKQARAEGLTV